MRTRLGMLLLVFLVVPALVLAQQSQSGQSQPPPAPAKKAPPKAEKQESQPAQQSGEQDDLKYSIGGSVATKPSKPATPSTAPKPGHALDPADVDVLTGKNKPQNYYGYGYVLVDPYGGYGQSMFTTPGGYGSSFTTPGGHYNRGYVSPLAIGRHGPGFVVGGTLGNFLRPGFRFF
jgi:hypothetical protein